MGVGRGPQEALQATRIRAVVVLRAEKGQVTMAELDEVPRDQLAAAVLVDRHRVRPGLVCRHEDRRDLAVDPRPDETWTIEEGEEDEATDAVVKHHVDGLLLAL